MNNVHIMYKKLKKIVGSLAWGLAPLGLWQLIFYIIPLLFVVLISFWTMQRYQISSTWTLKNYYTFFTFRPYYMGLFNSIWMAMLSVALTVLIAYPFAYALVFYVPRQYHLSILIAIIAPFWTSYLVRSYSWQIILGPSGIVNHFLMAIGLVKTPLKILFTPIATCIGLVHYLFPIMVLNLYMTMETIDKSKIEAAMDLGAGRLRTLFEVILPLSSTGLLSGSAFIFTLAFADFVSPSVLGGQMQPLLPILVADAVHWTVNWPLAAAIGVIMLIIILAVVAPFLRQMAAMGYERRI